VTSHRDLSHADTHTSVRYGEARSAAASCWAHDSGRQRRTACPLLYRYCLIHTYCSLARLPLTDLFVGAPILERHFQVRWRVRLPPPRVLLPHIYTQDGWFLQPKRRPLEISVVYYKRKRNILWNVRVFRGINKALEQQPRPTRLNL